MNKLLLLLALAALVVAAMAVTKEEHIAKKMAFKKGKAGKAPNQLNERMHKMKEQQNKHPKPSKKLNQEDKKAAEHKRKVTEERVQAKLELRQAQSKFHQDMADVRGDNTLSNREKQRKLVAMKQDFMANVSDLKERMGLDPSKTDRMAWKQAQLKKKKPMQMP